MKKLLLSCVVICATVFCAVNKSQAQENRIGIKAGVNLMTLGAATSNGVSINYDYRPGFQVGIFGRERLSENVSVSPQLLYTQKGGNVNTNLGGVNFNVKTQIGYLDVPVLFDFKLKPNFSFFVGPQASILLSQKTTATVNGETDSSTSTDGLRKFILGGNLGFAYNLTKSLDISLNYTVDFQHAADGNAGPDTGERNSGFGLSVGYFF